MNKIIISIIVLVIIGIGGYTLYQSQTNSPSPVIENHIVDTTMEKVDPAMMDESVPKTDTMMKDMEDAMVQDAMTMEYEFQGSLSDVSGGSSTGKAAANYSNGNYVLLASFQNLPEPTGTDFYEGWVVKLTADSSVPPRVVSTGKAELDQGGYINIYSSGQDLTDHALYVLTLEPDDGDPAPAKHILEGVLKMDGGAMEEKPVSYSGSVLAGSSSPLLDFKKADYDKALAANKKIALYFYASWCPTCKAEFPKMQAAFNQLDRDDVVGFRVNFKDSDTDSNETQLARDFGVAYQHTKVLLKDGNRVLKAPDSWDTNRYLSEIGKL